MALNDLLSDNWANDLLDIYLPPLVSQYCQIATSIGILIGNIFCKNAENRMISKYILHKC